MSDPKWNELEALWQGLPEAAAPVASELKRMKRWRWASRVLIAADVIMTLVGFGIAAWLFTKGDVFHVAFGAATVAFTAAAAGLSFWARWTKASNADASVGEALDLAVKNATIGVRLAVASFWTVFLGLLFTALLAFVRVWGDSVGMPRVEGLLMAIGATQIWLAIVQAGTIIYYSRRRADLERLERLRASFRGEV
jgi:hypothetical protein